MTNRSILRHPLACIVATLSLIATGPVGLHANDEEPRPNPRSKQTASRPVASAEQQQRLEREFAELLKNAALVGSWQLTNADGLEGKSPLGPPGEDRYEISEARKIGGDRWIIGARIRYAEHDVTLPVPVRIVWAEDTPIITVTDLVVPTIGTYSARVMFFGRFYAGIWRGKDYGGVMSGQIVPSTQPASTRPSK